MYRPSTLTICGHSGQWTTHTTNSDSDSVSRNTIRTTIPAAFAQICAKLKREAMLGYVQICLGRSTPEAATRCSRSSLWWSRLLMDLKLGDGSKIDRGSRSNLRDKGGLNAVTTTRKTSLCCFAKLKTAMYTVKFCCQNPTSSDCRRSTESYAL
jgi:hypothetical protein